MTKKRSELAIGQVGRSARMGWRSRGSLGLVIAAAAVGAGCVRRPAGPKAVFEPTHQDIRSIAAGESRDIRFRIRNEGSTTLHIEGIDTTCGCLTTRFPPSLSSGAAGEIRAHLEVP